MAYVIIPPEHQAAPKVAPRLVSPYTPAPKPSGDGRAPWESFDDEMHNPAWDAPGVREFEKRTLEKPPEQHVEEALRQYEMNCAQVKRYRWQGQERWQGRENEEMRLVRILHPHTFVEQLRRAGVVAEVNDPFEWFRENNVPVAEWPRPHVRLWLNAFSRAGRVGVSAVQQGEVKTITTLQYPYGPEYSLMRFDEHGLPSNERYRGWRTALLALILGGVLTEEEAGRAFGPALGAAGEFYREQLYKHRAITYGLRLRA